MSRRRGLLPTYNACAVARLLHGYALDVEQLELVSRPHRAHVAALGDMPRHHRPMEGSRYREGLADAEAGAAFLGLSRALADEVNADDFPESLRGAWAKLEGYAPRLALILHLLELAGDADRSGSGPIPDVPLRAVEGVGRLLAYFKSRATRVRASLDGKGASAGDDVQSLLLSIRRHELESCSENDARQATRRFNRDPLGLANAVNWLARQECIRRLPPYLGLRGRPKSPSCLVHPRLHRPPDSP